LAARTKARSRALDILFEADQRGVDPLKLLADRLAATGPEAPILNEYSVTLVRGVIDKQERIDELLSTYSHGWTLDRMPAVDRTALRIGVFELLYDDDVPAEVAVTEAVALVKNLSTDDSPAFVNGVLGSMLRDRGSLTP